MTKINTGIIRQSQIDASMQTELLSRDALLWLGGGVGDFPEQVSSIARLVALPWKSVLCESTSADLVAAFEIWKDHRVLVQRRGYLDVIASNPDQTLLPTRTLPVYLLNGREESQDPFERPNLSPQKAFLRRFTMLNSAVASQPTILVVVSSGDSSIVGNLCELWEEGFRSRVVFVTQNSEEIGDLDVRFVKKYSISALTVIEQSPTQFAETLARDIHAAVSEDLLLVRIRDRKKSVKVIDVTSCEKPDQPILDRYELIQEKFFESTLPNELSDEELSSFFERSSTSWRPYAAGLPWTRSRDAELQLNKFLRRVHERGPEQNRLLLIPAEPGSGGTTMLRHLCFTVAKDGYPTLVARAVDFEPKAHELNAFLFSLHQLDLEFRRDADDSEQERSDLETPVVLGFDAQHWRGHHESLISFFRSFERGGRSVVVLAVVDPDVLDLMPPEVTTELDTGLQHMLTQDEVLSLGDHLNRFLQPKGRDRSDSEWRQFHTGNQPRIGDFGASVATFWIALEFWLKRQFNLGESIQDWLYSQFKSANFDQDLKRLILRIAAATVERIGYPEDMMPASPDRDLPYSILLDRTRYSAPALGLVRHSSSIDRQWMLGHVQVARYLLNLAFRDRELLGEIGKSEVLNPIALRLELLREIACSPLLSQKKFKSLSVEFAKTILKLDRDGNREFFVEWQRVLDILENVSERVWETSRAFNHHVAISRRRVAADEEYFPLLNDEKMSQLEGAIEHLQFALEHIEATDEDDSDLNLLNSLARTYQDLVDLSLKQGNSDAATSFREKATECIRRAQMLSSNNSYVLETLAQDQLQRAEQLLTEDPKSAAALACESLGYLRQALTLDSAQQRQTKLNGLLLRCFQLLTGEAARAEICKMRERGECVGITAYAWLTLREGLPDWEVLTIEQLAPSTIDQALLVLGEIPPGKRTWLDLRLAYDLVCVRSPYDFEKQLELLDEFSMERPKTDFQTRLEHSILLYQVGRVGEGSEMFKRLRIDLKNSEVFVSIPDRLKLLCKRGSSDPEICSAVVVKEYEVRSYAAVQNLQREHVPFVPRQFNKPRMQVGERFQCVITFGHNGPFISPVKK
jgi:tetratricopeptide (TPR) repeat protein